METFYSYTYLRNDGIPYYVGKGCNGRVFEIHNFFPPPKNRSRIIIQFYESERDAFEAEIFLIAFYGRIDLGTGCLQNHTDGGEGTSGYQHTERAKLNIGQASRRPSSYEKKLKISTKLKNHPVSEVTCRKIASALLGKPSCLKGRVSPLRGRKGHPNPKNGKTHIEYFGNRVDSILTTKGTIWITNGIKNRRIRTPDSIPQGWQTGRAKYQYPRNRKSKVQKAAA